MKIFYDIQKLTSEYKNIAVALGMFDGVHIGHQSIIRRAVELAKNVDGTSAVFTFQNHPLSLLSIERENNRGLPKMIGDRKSRRDILEKLGIDLLIEIPFTREVSQISPVDFVTLLKENLSPRYVVTGSNFTFGHRGAGDQKMLREYGQQFGFEAVICQTILRDGKNVSSTRIRRLISEGNLAKANEFLGREFSYRSTVVHGFERGRTIGFPTANLEISSKRVMLPVGVYAVKILHDSKIYQGIGNIGNNPTFEEKIPSRIEVYIDDFSGDLYGQEIEVSFVEKMRDEKKFSNIDELKSQLQNDLEKMQKIFAKK